MAISGFTEIDIKIRFWKFAPTRWTGERNQEPEKELESELSFNKLSVKEAIRKLVEYLKD